MAASNTISTSAWRTGRVRRCRWRLPAGCRPDRRCAWMAAWLPRPASTENAAKETVLELPVPAGDRSGATHQFAVVFASARTAPWSWWTAPPGRIAAAAAAGRAAGLLGTPGGCRPGVQSARWKTSYRRRLPGPGEGFEPIDPRRWTPADRPLFRVPLWSTATKDTEAGQRQKPWPERGAGRTPRQCRPKPLPLAGGPGTSRGGAGARTGGASWSSTPRALRAAGLPAPDTAGHSFAYVSGRRGGAPWDGAGPRGRRGAGRHFY